MGVESCFHGTCGTTSRGVGERESRTGEVREGKPHYHFFKSRFCVVSSSVSQRMLKNLFRSMWGSNESRGFKVAAWSVALGAFGAYNWVTTAPTTISAEDKSKKQ
jgi:hypothetical protein